MYIYVHYDEDQLNGLAFNKAEKAAEYVIEKIKENIGLVKKKPSIKPKKSKSIAQRFTMPAPPNLVFDDDIAFPIRDPNPPVPQLFQQMEVAQAPRMPEAGIDVNTLLDLQIHLMVKPEDSKSPELLIEVKEQIAITTANKTIENAKKLIEQYDIYMKQVFGVDCPLHTIQEIGVADVKV